MKIKLKYVFIFILISTTGFLYGCTNSHYLKIHGKKLFIEIAYLPEEKIKGLSKRDSLPENHGMLFVYDKEQILYFWMKDTKIPLSIAFIRENGTVIGIYDMEPLSLETISSLYPCKYALEVNRGWFKKAGLKPGDYIKIPDFKILLKWHDEQKK